MWYDSQMSILIFIAILLVLVVSHEFGHFIVAKKSGIRVDEFSFGFPPKIFGKKIGETTYNFNALPFGGYVKIYGQGSDDFPGQNGEKVENQNDPRSFSSKPRYIQAAVLFAGVVMNFIVAWFLLTAGFMSGMPSSVSMAPKGVTVDNQYLTVTSVAKGSPAEISGLKTGDKLLVLRTGNDYTETPSADSVKYFVNKHADESIKIEYLRGSESMSLQVTPARSTPESVPVIGIAMDTVGTLKLPIHKAVWEGLKLTSNLTVGTAVGFYKLIAGAFTGTSDMSSITGPIGIVGVVGDAAKFGFVYLLSFTALISINLAVINLMPFPALDGGRLLFLLIEKIKGSKIKPSIENIVNMTGFGLLMLLMVFVTYHDIIKLI